jgi:transposase
MAKRKSSCQGQRREKTGKAVAVSATPTQIKQDVAGIDVGSEHHYVAVPDGRDPEPVRRFGSFTADLYRMVKWLLDCGIQSVVMQATGVYWFGLYQVLEDHGLAVTVTNARYTKMLPGRKTDVAECQWLQQLESFGLLTQSFRPTEEFRVLRSYMRQRENLVADIGICIQRIQKVLTEMNLQICNVLSDINGKSGMAILRAIIKGERDPYRLADLCDSRIQAPRQQVAESLEGTWQNELLFILKQQLEIHDALAAQVSQCDRQIEAHLQTIQQKVIPEVTPMPAARRPSQRLKRKHTPQYDLRKYLYQITGVDLTQIDGIGEQIALTVVSEVGVDMNRWKTEKNFASWLGLSPSNEKTGGKVIQRGTKKVVNRAATALRLAAQNLRTSQSFLGAKYRRFRGRMDAPKAITALAHNLATLIYPMLKFGHNYTDKGMQFYEQRYRERQLQYLKKQAAKQGFQLTPAQGVGA